MSVESSRAGEHIGHDGRPDFDAMRLFYQSTLDAMTTNVAVLNARGVVVSVNASWVKFIKAHDIDETGLAMGENFLDLCARKTGADFEAIHAGMTALAAGGPGPFRHEYLCPWIGAGHWSRMYAVRVGSMRSPFIIVSHEDVTEQRRNRRRELDITGRLLLAEDEERRRIGRALHDGAAQRLAAAKLLLASGSIADAGDLIAEAIIELRTLADRLHPPMLEPLGLCAAIRRHAGRFERETGLRVSLTLPEDMPRLPPAAEITLYRAALEALDNIARHSGSPTADLALTVENGRVRLAVRDHGVGGDCEAFERDGLGGLRLRVEQLGGGVSFVEASPGCRLTIDIPMPEPSIQDAAVGGSDGG